MTIDHEAIAERITKDEARMYALAVCARLPEEGAVTRAKLRSAIKRALDEASAATLLDRCHRALRAITAANYMEHSDGAVTACLTSKQFNSICDAITALETFAREHGIKLSEFSK